MMNNCVYFILTMSVGCYADFVVVHYLSPAEALFWIFGFNMGIFCEVSKVFPLSNIVIKY